MVGSDAVLTPSFALAAWLLALQSSAPATPDGIGEYATLIGGILAALGAALGLPITLLQLRKTRVEIRKLELESAALEANIPPTSEQLAGYSIDIGEIRAENVSFQVMVDPLLLGPMLLLLDFILIWIVLSLGNYAIAIFFDEALGTVVLGAVAFILFVPLIRETLHLKKVLKPQIQRRAAVSKSKTGDGQAA